MPNRLRRSGLSILGEVPWGCHFSVFYETKQDVLDTLVPYFKAGFEHNEFCLWVVGDPLTIEEASAALETNIPDIAEHLASGRMEIVDGHKWYYRRELKDVTRAWHEKLETALAKGGYGLRFAAHAFWLETDRRDAFLDYEREVDLSFEGRPILAICLYPLQASRGADVLEVAQAHGLTAARRNGEWKFIETGDGPTVHSLTLREMEVLGWVARGKSAREIGKILNITKRTVDEHARSAARKLGAANRAEASALAVQRKIIELDIETGSNLQR
jgi:DNA-binding CsgD family transcriptional regulator